MRNVVLDIDGCLADFEGAFCKKFGWEYRWMTRLEMRYPNREEEIQTFSALSKTYENLDIVELGIKIARFCENERFKISLISNRPYHVSESTGCWLRQNKVPFYSLSLVNGSKIKKIMRLNPVFVLDDMLSVVEECAEWGIPSFLVDQPWNQKENLDGSIHRIRNFDEFLGKFTSYLDI